MLRLPPGSIPPPRGGAFLASCVKVAVSAGDFAGRSGLQAAG